MGEIDIIILLPWYNLSSSSIYVAFTLRGEKKQVFKMNLFVYYLFLLEVTLTSQRHI